VVPIDAKNRGVTYQVRAYRLDDRKDKDRSIISEMKKNRSGLLIHYRNEYFRLFSLKGATPPTPEICLAGYDTLLLVRETHGDPQIQVLEILSEQPNLKRPKRKK
jgi:hypothetical protein